MVSLVHSLTGSEGTSSAESDVLELHQIHHHYNYTHKYTKINIYYHAYSIRSGALTFCLGVFNLRAENQIVFNNIISQGYVQL